MIVFAGAHLGYDLSELPLGGGAQVGRHLVEHWAESGRGELIVLGSGSGSGWSLPHTRYHNVTGENQRITDLTVRGYARFSRAFERGVTDYLRDALGAWDPREVVVLHNDICEAGDFRAIRAMGYRQATILHVDVVDYVANAYLGGRVSARTLARVAGGLERLRLMRLAPEVLQLIFEKQAACARHSDLLVVPSRGMAQVLRAAYPWRSEADVAVVPWGSLTSHVGSTDPMKVDELRQRYGIPESGTVLITLSRISPEKGHDLLLRGLRLWERRPSATEELWVFICGEAAYIHGASFAARVRRLASRLRRVGVVFPGYITGTEKAAHLALADLYVFPSRHESYGLTLVEAMAHGLPVLTTPHRSAAELVRPEFGRIVPASPVGLRDGLQELLKERAALPAMGGAAASFACGLSFSQAADALAVQLEKLVAS